MPVVVEIHYATERGTTHQRALALAEILAANNISYQLNDLADWEGLPRKDSVIYIFLTPTYGTGDPPEGVEEFYSMLKTHVRAREDVNPWAGIPLSVVGFGNKGYLEFCGFAVILHKSFKLLGAQQICKLKRFDTAADDHQEAFRLWAANIMVPAILAYAKSQPGGVVPDQACKTGSSLPGTQKGSKIRQESPQPPKEVELLHKGGDAGPTTSSGARGSDYALAASIHSPQSLKSMRNIPEDVQPQNARDRYCFRCSEFVLKDLKTYLSSADRKGFELYLEQRSSAEHSKAPSPGSCIALFPPLIPTQVAQLANCFYVENTPASLFMDYTLIFSSGSRAPVPQRTTLFDLFTYYTNFEFTPTIENWKEMRLMISRESILRTLLKDENWITTHIIEPQCTLAEVLIYFNSSLTPLMIPLAYVLHLPRTFPRMYTISSYSPETNAPFRLVITEVYNVRPSSESSIAPEIRSQRKLIGRMSSFLGHSTISGSDIEKLCDNPIPLKGVLLDGSFKASDAIGPAIWSATGSGLAPFLSFIEYRKHHQASHAENHPTYLLAGARSDLRADFPAKDELIQAVKQQIITSLFVGFSRQGPGGTQPGCYQYTLNDQWQLLGGCNSQCSHHLDKLLLLVGSDRLRPSLQSGLFVCGSLAAGTIIQNYLDADENLREVRQELIDMDRIRLELW